VNIPVLFLLTFCRKKLDGGVGVEKRPGKASGIFVFIVVKKMVGRD
jgi:hypothetical protein